MANKKILVSGIKPTGEMHIGNYFGALRQFVELQDKFESYIFVADLHALTTVQNREEMQENIFNTVVAYLACGLDPEKVVLYKQSDVPQVAELGWMFNCLTTMPYLMRAHAFKDAEAKNKEINVGVFDYPMLMAADILIQDADVVPVGQDQKQHIEIARDTAEKFNRIFPSATLGASSSDALKIPEAHILENVATVPGTDGQKMSKSYNNIIPLFATDEEIEKAVMGIVTDSGAGRPENVYAMHKLFRSEAELEKLYAEKEGKYKELKEALIEDVKTFIAPLREKRNELLKDRSAVLDIIRRGGERARARAESKMKMVREVTGLTLK